FAPDDVPGLFVAEARALGATVTLVEGLITDAARLVLAGAREGRWFDVSTLKEPYRAEGKKTMGYELAEQLDWELPDVVIYPTGGGTGLVGMWKAWEELEALGWIGSRRPRLVSVQSTGCAPIVRAFHAGAERAEMWEGAATIADGLRVPAAVGDFLMLRALRGSNGTAVAVTDGEILSAQRRIGALEGIFTAPEGAACLAALLRLQQQGWVGDEERVVLFNTGSGLKYYHLISA
ncbi:MAG TPA: threonine synthase, partial [Ardenticatenaceae bacterium]|nr:threonine synthase [Ardenticatenaceae bacterium]